MVQYHQYSRTTSCTVIHMDSQDAATFVCRQGCSKHHLRLCVCLAERFRSPNAGLKAQTWFYHFLRCLDATKSNSGNSLLDPKRGFRRSHISWLLRQLKRGCKFVFPDKYTFPFLPMLLLAPIFFPSILEHFLLIFADLVKN